jgi:hypothetical protein
MPGGLSVGRDQLVAAISRDIKTSLALLDEMPPDYEQVEREWLQ